MDLNVYRQNTSCLREKVENCPLCSTEKEDVELWSNGSYHRHIPCGRAGETIRLRVYRKLCSNPECRTSFSLHPEGLLNRQAYSLTVVSAWLWAFLVDGASLRSRDFLKSLNVHLPVPDSRMSWSDSLDFPGQRTRPGYQLLRYWSVLFCHRASTLLPLLVQAFAETQCLGALSEGWPVPERARDLQLAWLHWEALWKSRSKTADIDRQEAFCQMVRFLAKALSHKTRRAGGGRYPYDVIIS